MNYLDLLPLLSALFCAAIALFGFLRWRGRLGTLVFSLSMACLALMELANFAAIKATAGDGIILWKQVSLAGETLVAVSWLLFALVFGRDEVKGIVRRKWGWILAFACLMLISLLVSLSGHNQLVFTGEPGIIKLGHVARYFHIALILIVILSVVALENAFRSTPPPERWKIKNTFLGLGAILVFFIYMLSQRLLYHIIDLNNIYLMSGAIIISNIVITYSYMRSGIIVGDIYISRNILHGSISLFTIGIYILLVGLVGQLIRSLSISTTIRFNILFIFAAILALFVIFSKDTFKRSFRITLNRHFKKKKYDYREEWRLFSSLLSRKILLSEIIDTFLQSLSERMFLGRISLWLVDEDKSGLYMVSSRNLAKSSITVALDEQILSYLFQQDSPLSRGELLARAEFQPIGEGISTLLDETKAELLVPLILADSPVGLLTLGEIRGGEKFDEQDDYDLLKSVAAHAASAINSARLFEERMKARELEAFHRLSSFVMHDLKNATTMLSLVAQNARKHLCDPEFQKDALLTMSEAVTRMEKMISRLSTFDMDQERRREHDRGRFDDPAYKGAEGRDIYGLEFKTLDLNQIVKDAIGKIKINDLTQLTIEESLGQVSRVRGDVEEIYKVVYNLLLNACEAMNGQGHIKVSTGLNGDKVAFVVIDKGIGMSREFVENSLFRPFKSTKKRGLGIGLYQCKTIVEAHNGKIEVESELGVGTTFRVLLPRAGQELAGDSK